jgi:hypothetical protein
MIYPPQGSLRPHKMIVVTYIFPDVIKLPYLRAYNLCVKV